MWISEAAEAAGVNVETVRYYERRGLLEQPRRPVAGYRHYSDEVVRVVRFIKQAQDLGFTLDEIEELIHLRGNTPRGRERAREVSERKLTDLARKMAQLRDMQVTLRRLVAACRMGNTPECPILEALRSDGQTEELDDTARRQGRTPPATRMPSRKHASTRHQTGSAT